MQIHPEFDVITKTWFASGLEATSIRELIRKAETRFKKPITVKDYYPNGSPPIAYPGPSEDTLSRPTTPSLVTPPAHPATRMGRGAEALTLEEKRQAYEDVLNLWDVGQSIRQISVKLNLKYNYVGSNIIPNARLNGDPRANVRNRKTFGVSKGLKAPSGQSHAVDGDT